VAHVNEVGSQTLLSGTKSWFVGANIPSKARALILLYANTAPAYRAKCAEVAAKGYEGFAIESPLPVLGRGDAGGNPIRQLASKMGVRTG